MLNFNFKISFLKIVKVIFVRRITLKYIINITIGDINLPIYIPNFIQIYLNGKRIFAFKIPNIRKIIEIINRYILASSFLKNINKNIRKKIAKKVIPNSRDFFIINDITLNLKYELI